MLALKGITKFRSPTKADVTSPNIQTTTWPLSTVMEASLRVCREQRDTGERGGVWGEEKSKERGLEGAQTERSGGDTQRQTQIHRTEMSAGNRKLGNNVYEVTKSSLTVFRSV